PHRALALLEAKAEAQDRGREEAHVWPDGPLGAGPRRELRPVVAEAEGPARPGLEVAPHVIAVGIPLLEGRRRRRFGQLGGLLAQAKGSFDRGWWDRILPVGKQQLTTAREERVEPADRDGLELDVQAGITGVLV